MNVVELKKLYSKKDKMHNFNHIIRIEKNSNLIKRDYKNIDDNLLKFLILFHGLKEYVKTNQNKFGKYYVQSLYRSHNKPKRAEEKIVFDANLLDNLGETGIKKALYVGKLKKRSKKSTFEYIKKNIKKLKFYTKKGEEIGNKKIKEIGRKLK